MKSSSRTLASVLLGLGLLVGVSGNVAPQAQQPAPKPLPRIAAPDFNQPLPLPILATPVPDRAPLTDVTAASSHAAALSGALPVRTAPAPFVRHSIPDPFEHQKTMRLAPPLPEDSQPPPTVVPPLMK